MRTFLHTIAITVVALLMLATSASAGVLTESDAEAAALKVVKVLAQDVDDDPKLVVTDYGVNGCDAITQKKRRCHSFIDGDGTEGGTFHCTFDLIVKRRNGKAVVIDDAKVVCV